MSRKIRLGESEIGELVAEYERKLRACRLFSESLQLQFPARKQSEKATVVFSEKAWLKMMALVHHFSTEVAWHGVVDKTGKGEYTVSDILIYPQEVTGVTVEMLENEYGEWRYANAEDERFSRIHLQGHSHVNMSVNPSGVDLDDQQKIINMLQGGFYIFIIANKRGENFTTVYDLDDGIIYDDEDLTICTRYEEQGILELIDEAKTVVKQYQRVSTKPDKTKRAKGKRSFFESTSLPDDDELPRYYTSTLY